MTLDRFISARKVTSAARLAGSGCDYIRLQMLPGMIHAAEKANAKPKPLAVESRDDFATAMGAKPRPKAPGLLEQILAAFTPAEKPLQRGNAFEHMLIDPDADAHLMRGYYGQAGEPASALDRARQNFAERQARGGEQ